MYFVNGLLPIHPGEFLKENLEELGISQAEFARTVGVSAMRISHIINGTRPITAEIALILSQAFRQSPQYWLNLQSDYDLKIAHRITKVKLETIPQLTPA
ncbi:MAG: HigA family addiction module antidote protein [Desulfobacterales bacterium]|nr:HigA family addiction module antidote protein [Desulfobacterales bacterium]